MGGSDAFVELEFTLADDEHPAVRLSESLDCRVELLDAVRSSDETTTAFFDVTCGRSVAVAEHARPAGHARDVRVLKQHDRGCVAEVSLTESVFETLASVQVPLQSLVITDGVARFVATVPPERQPDDVFSLVQENHAGVTLVRKKPTRLAAPFATRTAFQSMLRERFTDRQWRALDLAFTHGYFDRPRRITQSGLSEKMDISPSTFGQHLHTALRKLLDTLFTDVD